MNSTLYSDKNRSIPTLSSTWPYMLLFSLKAENLFAWGSWSCTKASSMQTEAWKHQFCQERNLHFYFFQLALLKGCQLTPSLTSCSVAPTLYMSSCTASVNILWGLPLFPPPGSAVFTILCLVFLNIVSLTLSANLLFFKIFPNSAPQKSPKQRKTLKTS